MVVDLLMLLTAILIVVGILFVVFAASFDFVAAVVDSYKTLKGK